MVCAASRSDDKDHIVSKVESLQALVQRRAREVGGREGPLGNRQIARASKGALSHTLVGQIMNGEYANRAPGHKILQGLVDALGGSLSEYERAAGAPPSFGPFQLSDDAARLTPAQRKAVKHVVQVMIESAEAAKTAPVVPIDLPRAARTGRNRGKELREELDRQAEQGQPEGPEHGA
jgi:hypothetical protein